MTQRIARPYRTVVPGNRCAASHRDRRPRPSRCAIVIAVALLGCEEDAAQGPPLQPVPLTQADTRPGPVGRASPTPAVPSALPAGERFAGGLATDHPPVDNVAAGGATPAVLPSHPMDAGRLSWRTPEQWLPEQPASSMRLAQWRLGGSNIAEPVECALLRFPGGGSTSSNIARWVGQFSQPDGTPSAQRAEQDQFSRDGLTITTLRLTGTFNSRNPPMSGSVVQRPDWAIYAAVVDTAEGPYFLKCTGPQAEMTAQGVSVSAFIESLSMRE